MASNSLNISEQGLVYFDGISVFTGLQGSAGQIPIGTSSTTTPVMTTITAGTGISITNGSGSIIVSATGTTTLNYIDVDTTPWVVAANQDFLSAKSSIGAISIQLPNTTGTGRVFVVKDRTGNAAANNITVTTPGGVVLIDGSTTYVFNSNYGAAEFIFNGTSYEVF